MAGTWGAMRRHMRWNRWLSLGALVALGWLLSAAPVPAQARVSNVPTFNMNPPQQQQQSDSSLSITESNVGFIDPATPMNMIRLRGDANFNDVNVSRSEYLFAKPLSLSGRGMAVPEPKLDYVDVMLYGEYAWAPFFSTFAELPYRIVNPQVNANQRGLGDVNYGIKLCTWNSDNIIATFQFRLYNPTGSDGQGTHHWTAEPGLLASYKIMDGLLLEGEFRYWAPIGADEMAGDVMRYGLGLSYGTRNASSWWFIPVVEGVGWTVTSGEDLRVLTPTDFSIQSAQNQTIVNGYLGLRLGYTSHFDGYLGYGHCFTGNAWSRDMARIEFRFLY